MVYDRESGGHRKGRPGPSDLQVSGDTEIGDTIRDDIDNAENILLFVPKRGARVAVAEQPRETKGPDHSEDDSEEEEGIFLIV